VAARVKTWKTMPWSKLTPGCGRLALISRGRGRQTANPGKSGDNVPFDGKCAPHSINGLTDLDALPPIELFNLKSIFLFC
jgi:hypothetical protein